MDGFTLIIGFGMGIAFILLVNKLQAIRDKKQKAGELPQCPDCNFKRLFDDLGGEEDG